MRDSRDFAEQLDQIRWEDHAHAFGDAANLPSLLRGVEAGGPEAAAAISELFNTIWHQGTVYEATAVAVPFLGFLARETDGVSNRVLLMALLFAIGRGSGYWQRHAGTIARLGGLPGDVAEQLTDEQGWVEASRDAVARESILFLELLPVLAGRLWVSAATLIIVAGPDGTRFLPSLQNPPADIRAFARAGFDVIGHLLTTGAASNVEIEALVALDEDLADYYAQVAEDVTVDSYFVDVLIERMCDSQ